MAQAVLMVYENLDSIKENGAYWKDYVEFYEKYWDAPATPKSSWWGQEYDDFRESLSKQLGLEKKHIRDCFFTKDEENNYFICPIGTKVNLNIMACDNFIPLEWFLLFESSQKGYFYTHTGFGAVHHDAIYYSSDLAGSLERLNASLGILSAYVNDSSSDIGKYPELKNLSFVAQGVSHLQEWIKGFSDKGVIMLNYGEICNFIEPDSMKNEDSVGEVKKILESIEKEDLTSADSMLKLLNFKWLDISSKASGESENISLQ